MINVSKLKEGIVIDHIKAGHGYKIFQQLGLDKLDDVVVLMRNVDSTKMGRKDLIKIETNLDLNLEVLGLIDPNVTISYIKDGERVNKVSLTPPETVNGILTWVLAPLNGLLGLLRKIIQRQPPAAAAQLD